MCKLYEIKSSFLVFLNCGDEKFISLTYPSSIGYMWTSALK